MLHVWLIYLHLGNFGGKCWDSYSIHGASGFVSTLVPPNHWIVIQSVITVHDPLI